MNPYALRRRNLKQTEEPSAEASSSETATANAENATANDAALPTLAAPSRLEALAGALDTAMREGRWADVARIAAELEAGPHASG